MPIDLYIGPKKRGPPWWQGCFLTLIILGVGAYLSILILAANGIYVAEGVPLPESLQASPTPSPTPTMTAQTHLQKADAFFADGQLEAAVVEYQMASALEPMNDV